MRSDAFIIVTCDMCHCEEQVQLTATAGGYDERHVDAELRRMGWDTSDGMDVCPECQNENEL